MVVCKRCVLHRVIKTEEKKRKEEEKGGGKMEIIFFYIFKSVRMFPFAQKSRFDQTR